MVLAEAQLAHYASQVPVRASRMSFVELSHRSITESPVFPYYSFTPWLHHSVWLALLATLNGDRRSVTLPRDEAKGDARVAPPVHAGTGPWPSWNEVTRRISRMSNTCCGADMSRRRNWDSDSRKLNRGCCGIRRSTPGSLDEKSKSLS